MNPTKAPNNSSGTNLHSRQVSDLVDVCIIGGGINGAGVARDAAGRGLSVMLVEKDDLSQGTSSRSGKLVHGGLRYLEYYEFRLVREALIEREVLLASAPHIIWPMRFVLPHSKEDRPAWLVRAGLFLYDHLGGRKKLPATRVLNLHSAMEGDALKDQYTKAFEYSDCWVDDARLVVLNALSAAEHGALIRTRTHCESARRVNGHWEVTLRDRRSNEIEVIKARSIINAAGPWVNTIIQSTDSVKSQRNVRLVKGSHIVVKKFWEGDHAYLVQNHDKRVIFINPYENGRALIGTTDIPFEGDADEVAIDEAEISYLIAAVNRYFKHELATNNILQTFSGVRPLFDDDAENPSAVTRDYLFDVNGTVGDAHKAPILSVFGGKITTFRKLAEHALDKLRPFFPNMGKAWTSGKPLPGGDIEQGDFERFAQQLVVRYPQLPPALLYQYGRRYGSRSHQLLAGIETTGDLGKQFSEACFEAEMQFLIQHEWAISRDDLLKRRTKHALHMSDQEIATFDAWLEDHVDQRERYS